MPLISCIAPTTASRSRFMPMLLRSFNSQSHANRELVVISEDPINLPDQPNIRLVKCEPGLTIGTKRNIGIQAAHGEYIAHMDSDDYSAPERLADQLDLSRLTGCAVVGYCSIPFYNIDIQEAFKIRVADTHWCCGNTLFYIRDYALEFPFPDKQLGEDVDFVNRAASLGQVFAVDGRCKVIAIDHDDNTSPRDYNPWLYTEVQAPPLRTILEPEISTF